MCVCVYVGGERKGGGRLGARTSEQLPWRWCLSALLNWLCWDYQCHPCRKHALSQICCYYEKWGAAFKVCCGGLCFNVCFSSFQSRLRQSSRSKASSSLILEEEKENKESREREGGREGNKTETERLGERASERQGRTAVWSSACTGCLCKADHVFARRDLRVASGSF